MKKNYNIVELFSGIGSQARALKNIGIDITVQATCEWDIHAFIAYDAIHESYTNLPEVEMLTKEQILEKLKNYTLSNNGKEPMTYATLHSYSEEVLKRILSAIIRTHNLVDISNVKGDQMPDNTDILTYSFLVRIYQMSELFMAIIKALTEIPEAVPVCSGRLEEY